MKKLLFMLSLSTILILSACGAKNTADNKPSSTTEKEAAKPGEDTAQKENGSSSKTDAAGKADTDKEQSDVEFTLPDTYVDGQTQEDLDKQCKENGYKSITLNDDGSATYVMTKKQHKEMMTSMADTIDSSIKELIGSKDYPTFKDIKANEDYTEFTVTTTSTELALNESLAPMMFYTYGLMYNVYNGTEADNIAVTFVNADTGKTISTSNSSDLDE